MTRGIVVLNIIKQLKFFSSPSFLQSLPPKFAKYKSFSKLDLLILNFNFRKIFICLEKLDTIFSIWAFHLASVLNVTPMCLYESIVEIILSSKVKFISGCSKFVLHYFCFVWIERHKPTLRPFL